VVGYAVSCDSLCLTIHEGYCFHKVQRFINCFLPSCANFFLLLNGSKGSIVGHWVKAVQPVRFIQGNNDLLLLTQTVGLQVNIYYLISLFIFFLTANCDHFRLWYRIMVLSWRRMEPVLEAKLSLLDSRMEI